MEQPSRTQSTATIDGSSPSSSARPTTTFSAHLRQVHDLFQKFLENIAASKRKKMEAAPSIDFDFPPIAWYVRYLIPLVETQLTLLKVAYTFMEPWELVRHTSRSQALTSSRISFNKLDATWRSLRLKTLKDIQEQIRPGHEFTMQELVLPVTKLVDDVWEHNCELYKLVQSHEGVWKGHLGDRWCKKTQTSIKDASTKTYNLAKSLREDLISMADKRTFDKLLLHTGDSVNLNSWRRNIKNKVSRSPSQTPHIFKDALNDLRAALPEASNDELTIPHQGTLSHLLKEVDHTRTLMKQSLVGIGVRYVVICWEVDVKKEGLDRLGRCVREAMNSSLSTEGSTNPPLLSFEETIEELQWFRKQFESQVPYEASKAIQKWWQKKLKGDRPTESRELPSDNDLNRFLRPMITQLRWKLHLYRAMSRRMKIDDSLRPKIDRQLYDLGKIHKQLNEQLEGWQERVPRELAKIAVVVNNRYRDIVCKKLGRTELQLTPHSDAYLREIYYSVNHELEAHTSSSSRDVRNVASRACKRLIHIKKKIFLKPTEPSPSIERSNSKSVHSQLLELFRCSHYLDERNVTKAKGCLWSANNDQLMNTNELGWLAVTQVEGEESLWEVSVQTRLQTKVLTLPRIPTGDRLLNAAVFTAVLPGVASSGYASWSLVPSEATPISRLAVTVITALATLGGSQVLGPSYLMLLRFPLFVASAHPWFHRRCGQSPVLRSGNDRISRIWAQMRENLRRRLESTGKGTAKVVVEQAGEVADHLYEAAEELPLQVVVQPLAHKTKKNVDRVKVKADQTIDSGASWLSEYAVSSAESLSVKIIDQGAYLLCAQSSAVTLPGCIMLFASRSISDALREGWESSQARRQLALHAVAHLALWATGGAWPTYLVYFGGYAGFAVYGELQKTVEVSDDEELRETLSFSGFASYCWQAGKAITGILAEPVVSLGRWSLRTFFGRSQLNNQAQAVEEQTRKGKGKEKEK